MNFIPRLIHFLNLLVSDGQTPGPDGNVYPATTDKVWGNDGTSHRWVTPSQASGALLRRTVSGKRVTLYFELLQAAINASTSASDVIEGYGDLDDFALDKTLTLDLRNARFTTTSGNQGCSVGFGASTRITPRILGGTYLGRLALCRGHANHDVLLIEPDLSAPTAFVQMLGLFSSAAVRPTYTVVRGRINHVTFINRNDSQQDMALVCKWTEFGFPGSPDANVIEGLIHPDSVLNLFDCYGYKGSGPFMLLNNINGQRLNFKLSAVLHVNDTLPAEYSNAIPDGWRTMAPQHLPGTGLNWSPVPSEVPVDKMQQVMALNYVDNQSVSTPAWSVPGQDSFQATDTDGNTWTYQCGYERYTPPAQPGGSIVWFRILIVLP